MKIYVASSWRNEAQPAIVTVLREARHEVYDFRHPAMDDEGFHWSEVDPDWLEWDAETFRQALEHPLAEEGFARDFAAMAWADVFLLVMPCGKSAHLELGWATGAGKLSIILLDGGEPELMYKLADLLCVSMEEVLLALRKASV